MPAGGGLALWKRGTGTDWTSGASFVCAEAGSSGDRRGIGADGSASGGHGAADEEYEKRSYINVIRDGTTGWVPSLDFERKKRAASDCLQRAGAEGGI